MALYAIGDVQGCYDELRALLREVNFRPAHDTLWFSGDLVNRGPKSLDVLRFVADLGERGLTVLGNHDLHMLAVVENKETFRRGDTFRDVLNAKDGDELTDWLRAQPLLHHDAEHDLTLIHAGLAPQWSIAQAQALSAEVSAVLRGKGYREFFEHMYGNEPDNWDDALKDWDRLRFITNTFTRLRVCAPNGQQYLKFKGALGSQPDRFIPWFDVPQRAARGRTLLFGHWAALGAGVHGDGTVFSLDSGCAWGGQLSALKVDGSVRRFFSVPCAGYADITEP